MLGGGLLKSLLQGLFLFHVFVIYYLMNSKWNSKYIHQPSALCVAAPFSSGMFSSCQWLRWWWNSWLENCIRKDRSVHAAVTNIHCNFSGLTQQSLGRAAEVLSQAVTERSRITPFCASAMSTHAFKGIIKGKREI